MKGTVLNVPTMNIVAKANKHQSKRLIDGTQPGKIFKLKEEVVNGNSGGPH